MPEEVDAGQDARLASVSWLLTTAFKAGAKKKQGRATHKTGVGARGRLTVGQPSIPTHEVWRPGRIFDVVLRHANLNNDDDLSADYRGAALKLSEGGDHIVDLLFNTGVTTVWCHVSMFAERMMLMARKKLPVFYERHPDALDRYWGGLRRAPDGYEGLAYYSKLSGKYIGTDGVTRTCRYRLLPASWDGKESGLPTERDRREGVLFTDRWPEEKRSPDTLRRAYASRLREGPIRYTLQIAVRDASDDFRDPLFDPCTAWDEADHPWLDLAALTIDTSMPDAEVEPLEFSIGNAPPSLGVFPASSPTEYTSVGHLRASLYPKAASKRPK